MRKSVINRENGEVQLPLFRPALLELSQAYGDVEALRLDEAQQAFKEYLRVFPADPEVVNGLSSLQWLARCRPRSPVPTEEELFTWWRKIEKDAELYKILDTNLHRSLKRGILRRMIAGLATSGRKRIRGVHIGLLYFEMEQYSEAIRELRQAVGERPDSSSLWGPLAEAEYRSGHARQAEKAYSLALLYEPLECGFRKFSHPGISQVQRKLEGIGMSAELALENLLVQCWLEGLLSLPPMPSVISLQDLLGKARELEARAGKHGRLVLLEDARLFRWCLQVSEWMRLEDAGQGDDRAWAMGHLKELDSRAFRAYEERLRLQNLQTEETAAVPWPSSRPVRA